MTAGDTAGVVAPPPLIALAAIVLGVGLDWLLPVGLLAAMNVDLRLVLAIAAAAPGLWLGLRAIAAFRRAGTHVEPWKPSTALVTQGVYAFVRNPMYLALGLGILAIAFVAASDWTLLMLVPFALLIHFGVVLREERYLRAKFGEEYRRYSERAPRYVWRF